MKLDTTEQLGSLQFDERGLVPVIAQHAHTGEVLMLAYANREAIERTLHDRQLWFYSRSRQALWRKGETSGNTQTLVALQIDCDGDALLAQVIPAGPACHTGARNCFGALPTLPALGEIIAARAQAPTEGSYTARLLGDANLRLKKLGEEATELALACQSHERERIIAESADLLYHVLVAGEAEQVEVADVLAELARRLEKRNG
jgi:phosphoribosyl-AMP cyclohydrolase / phosphoribosyl-ATP pyrophosphohydrolase